MKKLFCGNLAWGTTEEDLRHFFAASGQSGYAVGDISVVTDRDTGRSRGFAFVEVDDQIIDQVIEDCDGQDLDGRQLNINEARPKPGRNDNRGDRGGDRSRGGNARGARRGE